MADQEELKREITIRFVADKAVLELLRSIDSKLGSISKYLAVTGCSADERRGYDLFADQAEKEEAVEVSKPALEPVRKPERSDRKRVPTWTMKKQAVKQRLEKKFGKGKTLKEMALEMGFSHDQLGKWLRGACAAKESSLIKIANVLDCTLDEIATHR